MKIRVSNKQISTSTTKPVNSLHTHSGQVFLGQAFVLPAFLNNLAHFQGNSVVVQLLSFPVQFSRVLRHKVLFVLPSRPCVTM